MGSSSTQSSRGVNPVETTQDHALVHDGETYCHLFWYAVPGDLATRSAVSVCGKCPSAEQEPHPTGPDVPKDTAYCPACGLPRCRECLR